MELSQIRLPMEAPPDLQGEWAIFCDPLNGQTGYLVVPLNHFTCLGLTFLFFLNHR